jgi:multidrug efflux pump subunit AcrA (membrane-fusion protein)
MAETRQCYFVSNVEAKTGWNLKTGQTVQLQIETGPGLAPVQGTVVFVSPVVDPASGLMRVKVLFSNLDGKIRPGVAGKMRLEGVANGK